uniref:Uncharacterized protein n=1 Tax=Ditylenchus dipsaci TaxID=166011 RepID=A0A915EMG9_9BILA
MSQLLTRINISVNEQKKRLSYLRQYGLLALRDEVGKDLSDYRDDNIRPIKQGNEANEVSECLYALVRLMGDVGKLSSAQINERDIQISRAIAIAIKKEEVANEKKLVFESVTECFDGLISLANDSRFSLIQKAKRAAKISCAAANSLEQEKKAFIKKRMAKD